jgi:uncharacterized membrane protein YebE (DUF533 family)
MNNLKIDWDNVNKAIGVITAIASAVTGIAYAAKAYIEWKQSNEERPKEIPEENQQSDSS